MAQTLKRLSDPEVRNAKGPALLADGGGLYLQVTKTGSKSWLFIYRRKVPGSEKSKRTEIGLGSLTAVTLKAARTMAEECRALVEARKDPKAVRKAESQIPTFGQLADEFIKSSKWKNDKHLAQWQMTLTKYAKPLRDMPVDTITPADVVAVLKPLWEGREETADRLRGRIERVMRIAKVRNHFTGENPATWEGNIEAHFTRTPKKQRVEHHASMPWADVPAFLVKLRDREGQRIVRRKGGVGALALEFLVLTACRSGEVREAVWEEFDLVAKKWTIPAVRMKAGDLHEVPLTDRMLAIIEEVRPFRRNAAGSFVFPGTKLDRPLSDMTLTAVLKRMKVEDVTCHGFRSSFREWCGDATSFPRELAEHALAHAVGDRVERAYRRGAAFERRRELMRAWEKHCLTPDLASNITPLPVRKFG
jgi:integrase